VLNEFQDGYEYTTFTFDRRGTAIPYVCAIAGRNAHSSLPTDRATVPDDAAEEDVVGQLRLLEDKERTRFSNSRRTR